MWSFVFQDEDRCQGSSRLLNTPREQSKQRWKEGGKGFKMDWNKWYSLAIRWMVRGEKRTVNIEIKMEHPTISLNKAWFNLYQITLAGRITLMCKHGRWQILVPHLLNYVADPGTPQSQLKALLAPMSTISAVLMRMAGQKYSVSGNDPSIHHLSLLDYIYIIFNYKTRSLC